MRAIGLCRRKFAYSSGSATLCLALRTQTIQAQQSHATSCSEPRTSPPRSRSLHGGGTIATTLRASQQLALADEAYVDILTDPSPGMGRNSDSDEQTTQNSHSDEHTKRNPDSDQTVTRRLPRRQRLKRPSYFKSQKDRQAWLREGKQQWGYVKHQNLDEDELRVARRRLNWWRKKYRRVLERPLPSWPLIQKARWLLDHESVADMGAAWHELDESTRRETWPSVMLSTMCLSPRSVANVLQATLDPLPPGYAINDALLFVAVEALPHMPATLRKRTSEVDEVMQLLQRLFNDCPPGHVRFSQRTWGILAKKLPSAQVFELYTLLHESQHTLHPNTRLHIARRLAADPMYKRTAFGILQGLAEERTNLNKKQPASVITSLLHTQPTAGLDEQPGEDDDEDDSSFSASDAITYFIEQGFRPNVVNATAYLGTLCQRGEVDEAIRLALVFREEAGIGLDKRVWTTVFRGAKSSLSVENMSKATDVAKAAGVPLINVLNNALHGIYYFSEMERRDRGLRKLDSLAPFGPLLRMYAKRFPLEPLQWWFPEALPLDLAEGVGTGQDGAGGRKRWEYESTILPFVSDLFSTGGSRKLQPTPTTIATLLRAYIRSLRRPADLASYYDFFKSRLEEQTRNSLLPRTSRLVESQGSLIHDTIILAMTEHREHMSQSALAVFADMLKDNFRHPPSTATCVDGKDRVHPAPTVLTFTILLRGLMNPRDRVLVNQVLQLMREQGVEPTQATWNTLIKGYAMGQDIGKTVSALQDMEAAGHQPDVYTYQAFGRLRNQARALRMMDEVIHAAERSVIV
ncbi:pentatricopeptide repeat protein [Moelleriella libera RCEF 2490]|uniref:Pentatricopeptide repeat protein n=1 Tax=Moelleriella libera RCEF 2490 TaxID=1081109 RepID=A0A166V3X1_9HYPO|nr:pentatricopeptide repeat protein [Moelleriella libera RCEF 2490]